MLIGISRRSPIRTCPMSRRPLTSRVGVPKFRDARRPDGRFPPRAERGKSGLHGGAVPGNARRGRPQGKCHRKYTAGPSRDTRRPARVKWCGKSAPRRRQRRRQGKPHREQDQVGAAGICGVVRRCRASLRAAARVGRTRRSVTSALEEWPSSPMHAHGRDRTRLIRRLALLLEHFKNAVQAPRQFSCCL